jgi:hypothetical protein
MAEPDISQVLTQILERQSDVEKVQATHEQVLSNLVQSSEHIVNRMEKIEEGFHQRFDKLEERQRFPVGHILTFIGIFLTIGALCCAGFAYYMSLSDQPALLKLEAVDGRVAALEAEIRVDDRQEIQHGMDRASLRAYVEQQESLNNHLHATKKKQIEDLQTELHNHVDLAGHPTAVEKNKETEKHFEDMNQMLTKQLDGLRAELGSIRGAQQTAIQTVLEQMDIQVRTRTEADRAIKLSQIHQEILQALRDISLAHPKKGTE